eukprot:UN01748
MEGGSICAKPIIEEDLRSIVDNDTFSKYERFKNLLEKPDTRECPYSGCGHSQVGSIKIPKMICEKCKREHCFTHSNAHPGQTCVEYEKQADVKTF